MSFDALFYCTGLMAWSGVALFLVWFLSLLAWRYLSISISLWWIVLRANKRYPDGEAVKPEWKAKRLWKIRLLAHFLSDPKGIVDAYGSTMSGAGWTANYRGFWPKVSVVEYS